VVLLDDLPTHAKPQAAAAVALIVGLFGRVERLENQAKLFGRNADAGIADRDLGHPGLGVFTHVDREPTAFLHRLPGVDDEVQENLLDLAADDGNLGATVKTLLGLNLVLTQILSVRTSTSSTSGTRSVTSRWMAPLRANPSMLEMMTAARWLPLRIFSNACCLLASEHSGRRPSLA